MKAVILAAGRGTRLAPLTDSLPKTLAPLSDTQTILDHILMTLPSRINEVLVVAGYKSELVKSHLASVAPPDRSVTIIEQGELGGTWGAVWSVRSYMNPAEPFLVLNGDDIYDPGQLAKFAECSPLAVGLQTRVMSPAYYAVKVVGQSFRGFRRQTEEELLVGAPVCTGAYILEAGIFATEPVNIGGNEYGLPQTLLKYNSEPNVFRFTTWHPINTMAELAGAKQFVSSKK